MTNDGQGNYSLTSRESRALALICSGVRYSEVARQLGVTVNTIHRYASTFFRACDCHSRGELRELMARQTERKAA